MTSRHKALSLGHIRKTIQNLDQLTITTTTTTTTTATTPDDPSSHLSTRASNRAPRPQSTLSTPAGPTSARVSPRSSQPSLSSHPTPSSSTHSLPTPITSSADSDHASIAEKRPAQRPSGPNFSYPRHSSNANQHRSELPSLGEAANGAGSNGRKRVEGRGGRSARRASMESIRRAATSNNNSSTDLGAGGASGSMPTTTTQQPQERMRAFDREKIGLAGKGYGSLLEEDNDEEIGKLLDEVTTDDILKLTQLTKSHHPKPKAINASTSALQHKEASAKRSSVALATTDEDILPPIPHNPDFHPSANTLALSRRFKDAVSQKYIYIYATINRGESYNPLQAIRDRPIRASDHDGPTATMTHDEPRTASQRQSQHIVRHVSSGPLGRRKKPSEWLVSADEMEEEDAWRRANPNKILSPGRVPPRVNPTVSTSASSHGTSKVTQHSLSDDGRWSGRSSFEDVPRIHIESSEGPYQGLGLRPTNNPALPQPSTSISPFQSDSDGVGGEFDSPPRSPRPPNIENPRPIRPDPLRFHLSQSEGASPASSPSVSPPGSPRRIGSPLSRVLTSERENYSSPDVLMRDRYDDEEDEHAPLGALMSHRDKRKTWHIPPLFKKDKTFLLKKHHRNTSLPHASIPDDDDPTISAFVSHDDFPPHARSPPNRGGERMARTGSAPSSHGPFLNDRLSTILPDMSHPTQDSSSLLFLPRVYSEPTTTKLAVVDTHELRRKRSSSTSIAMSSKGEAAPMSPTPLNADDSASIMGLPPTRRHSFDYTTTLRGGEMMRLGSAPIEEGTGGKKITKKIHYLKVPGMDGTGASDVESGGEEGGRSEWEERDGEGGRKDRWRFFRPGRSDAESDNSSSNRSVQPPSEKHSSTDFVRSANTSKLIPPSMRSSFEDDTRPPLSDICSTAVPEEDGEVRPQAHRNRGHEPALADSLESMIGSRPPSPDPLEVLAPMSRIVTVDLDALPKELGDIVERYREMGKVVPIEKKKKGKGKEGKSEEREDDGVERTDDETSTEEEDEGEKEEGPGVEEGAEGEKSGKGNLVEIEVSESDDISFVKRIHHDDDSIIELRVSILGDPEKDYKSKQIEMKVILDKYVEQIERLEKSLAESEQLLHENQNVMDDLCLDHLDEDGNWVISTSSSLPDTSPFTNSQQLPIGSSPFSSPQLESSPSPFSNSPARGTTSSSPDEQMILKRAPTIVRNSPSGALSSFEYILHETQLSQSTLRSDMDILERGIGATQSMLRELAGEIRITLDRYEDMTLEISEDYYHHLKMLEDDIVAINAKRAENPWLDAAYATLSYVLTFIAFIFWFTVQLFKAGRAVAIFPRTLWKAYSEYLENRKKVAAVVDHGRVSAPMPPRTLPNSMGARANRGAVME